MVNLINQKTILIFIGLSMIFLKRLTIYGIDVLTPILASTLVCYTSVYVIRRKEMNALTYITLLVLLIGIILKIYEKRPV